MQVSIIFHKLLSRTLPHNYFLDFPTLGIESLLIYGRNISMRVDALVICQFAQRCQQQHPLLLIKPSFSHRFLRLFWPQFDAYCDIVICIQGSSSSPHAQHSLFFVLFVQAFRKEISTFLCNTVLSLSPSHIPLSLLNYLGQIHNRFQAKPFQL